MYNYFQWFSLFLTLWQWGNIEKYDHWVLPQLKLMMVTVIKGSSCSIQNLKKVPTDEWCKAFKMKQKGNKWISSCLQKDIKNLIKVYKLELNCYSCIRECPRKGTSRNFQNRWGYIN